MRLRQVAVVVTDLDRTIDDIKTVLGLEVGLTVEDELALWGPDLVERFGLRNAVFPVGDTFVEIITPDRDGTPLARFHARRGDSGYMVLLQTDDLPAARARAAAMGIREVFESPLPDISGVHFDPRDTGGSLMSIEQPDDPTEWPWAGYTWRQAVRTDVVTELVGVDIETVDPPTTAAVWARLCDRPILAGAAGAPVLQLDRGWIRFLPAGDHGEGVCGLTFSSPAPGILLTRAAAAGLPVERPHVVIAGVPIECETLSGG